MEFLTAEKRETPKNDLILGGICVPTGRPLNEVMISFFK